MGHKLEDSPLYDADANDDIEDLGDLFDGEPVPTRRSAGTKAPGRNHRRSIEELQEERMLRSMLSDLEQEFPDI